MDARAVVAGLLHELGLPDPVLSLVVAHAAAVEREADRLGLVAERSLPEILTRHSADSLLLALVRRPGPQETWVDVGSGAGFPGVVLAACYPQTRFVLLEPQQRRAGFLDLQVLTLGLGNAEVQRRRVQSSAPGSADVVVTRALEDTDATFPLLTRPLKPGGLVLIAAGPSTSRPTGAEEVPVRRPGVDSPGQVLMIRTENRAER